jgi:hypothetical protein
VVGMMRFVLLLRGPCLPIPMPVFRGAGHRGRVLPAPNTSSQVLEKSELRA